jgi:diguanylate cyclase (GGDEF)-like protein
MSKGMFMRHINFFYQFFVFYCLVGCQLSFANPDYRFKTLNTSDGLQSNEIYKIFQQKNGFIWFASDHGVSRYDGLLFEHYHYAPGQINHISNNQITDILEDSRGNIWISTEAGLNKISPDGAVSLFQPDPKQPNYLDQIWLLSLFEDTQGILWLGTGKNLKRYDPVENQFVTYTLSMPDESTYALAIYQIAETSLGLLYLATSKGLAIVDHDSKQFSLVAKVNSQLVDEDSTHLLTVLSDDTLLLGTRKSGLLLYDITTKELQQLINQKDGRSLAANNIASLMVNPNGDIWIGHSDMGISIYHRQHGTFSYIKAEEFGSYSLPSNTVQSLLIDKSGLYWIGTSEGVALYSPLQLGSQIYRKHPVNSGLSSNYIYDMYADDKDNIWLATSNGINRLNTLTQTIAVFPLTDPNGGQYNEQSIYQISAAADHQLWLGTDEGLKLFDPLTGFSRGGQGQPALPNSPIYTLLPTKDDNLWITGYINVGLRLFHQDKGVSKVFLDDENSEYFAGGNFTNAKILSSLGELWLATTDGLVRVNPESGLVNHYEIGGKQGNTKVTSIVEGQDNTFWLTTDGEGLLRVSSLPEEDDLLDIQYVTKPYGLGQNELQAVLKDGDTLWLSSRTELIKFNVTTGKWQLFPSLIGDDQLLFLENAILKVGNILYLGSTRGLVSVDTTKLFSNKFDAPVKITGVTAGGHQLLSHHDSLLAPPISLAYQENSLQITFAALDFTNSLNNQYQFKLEGMDESWVNTAQKGVVYFNSLSAGDYIFKVKGTNSDGLWSSQIASISFTIERPWWFYIILTLVVLLILLALKFLLKGKHYMSFLHEKAHVDTLTSIANRYSFNTQLTQHMANQSPFALVNLDLDNFKDVNDRYGHHVGDSLLIEAGKRIQSCIRKNDTLGRLGGDEFAIIVTRFQGLPDLYEITERIRSVLSQKYFLEEHIIVSSSSIGIALYPNDTTDKATLLSYADAAMYAAKQHGGDHVFMFNKSLSQALSKKEKMLNNLKQALGNAELYLLYQPQIHQFTDKMVGVEALLRWRHPIEGNYSAYEFIPEAESNGTIIDIGNWVIETACKQAKHWQQIDVDGFKVSINISVVQILQADFVGNVKKIIAKTAVDPQLIEFEITESVLIENFSKCQKILTQIQGLGITIAIDDFGVGFSSFNYLTQFSFDTLKIDQSFVKDIKLNNLNYKVVKNIYQLAKDLDLEVVAEGVEHEEQLFLLAQFDGAIIQGHYFCYALEAEVITNLLSHQSLDMQPISTLFAQQLNMN